MRTASAPRGSPGNSEQRSLEMRSGSIGTTRSGKYTELPRVRSAEHTAELHSHLNVACRLVRDTLTRGNSVYFPDRVRSEEHTSELHSPVNIVCRLLLDKN